MQDSQMQRDLGKLEGIVDSLSSRLDETRDTFDRRLSRVETTVEATHNMLQQMQGGKKAMFSLIVISGTLGATLAKLGEWLK